MKEQITEKAVEVIASTEDPLKAALAELINSVTTAKDFIVAEVPEVISQLLVWSFIKSFAEFLFAIGLWIGMAFITRKILSEWGKIYGTLEEFVILPFILVYVPLCFVPLTWMNITWLQIWVAPKIFLIEYAANLVK